MNPALAHVSSEPVPPIALARTATAGPWPADRAAAPIPVPDGGRSGRVLPIGAILPEVLKRYQLGLLTEGGPAGHAD